MSTTLAPRRSISARSAGFEASIAPTRWRELATKLDSDSARSFGVAKTVTLAGRTRAICEENTAMSMSGEARITLSRWPPRSRSPAFADERNASIVSHPPIEWATS